MNHKITKSAGGVVLNINKDVLIVNQNYDSWSLPKGHIDPGETAFEAAKRCSFCQKLFRTKKLNELALKKNGFKLQTFTKFMYLTGLVFEKSIITCFTN